MATPVSGFAKVVRNVGDFLLRPREADQNTNLRLVGSIAVGVLTLGTAHALFGAINYFKPGSVTNDTANPSTGRQVAVAAVAARRFFQLSDDEEAHLPNDGLNKIRIRLNEFENKINNARINIEHNKDPDRLNSLNNNLHILESGFATILGEINPQPTVQLSIESRQAQLRVVNSILEMIQGQKDQLNTESTTLTSPRVKVSLNDESRLMLIEGILPKLNASYDSLTNYRNQLTAD